MDEKTLTYDKGLYGDMTNRLDNIDEANSLIQNAKGTIDPVADANRLITEAKGGIAPVSPESVQDTSTISNVIQPQEPPTPTVESLMDETYNNITPTGTTSEAPVGVVPTPSENQFGSFMSELDSINRDLVGESTFRSQQEQEAGIPELEKNLSDLGLRLRDLQREEQAIPLQIQQESIGRGRTSAGIAPIQTERLRNNAIQALTVSSLIDGAKNNITSALSKVERAVEAQFGKAKAQKTALMENLDLLIKSGQLTRDEQRRAEAVKNNTVKELDQIEQQRAEQEQIWSIAVESAPFLSQSATGLDILNQIQNANSREEAFAIASANGVFLAGAPQNSFSMRLDAQGNLVQYETAPNGQVVGQRVLSYKDAGGSIASNYTKERAGRVISSIDSLATDINGWTTGLGAFFLNRLPATDARNFRSRLSTLKSNIAFNELTAMREASKTGGALGAISERELDLLQNSLGGLDQLQSGEDLSAELAKIKASIQRWQEAVGDKTITTSSTGIPITAPDGSEVIIVEG